MAEDKQFEKDSSSPKKKKSGPKPGAKAKPAGAPAENDAFDELDTPSQTISLFLAVGLIVSSLVVGLVVGYVVAPKSAATDLGATAPAGTAAPALTPDQINSNQLPPSHPALPGTGGESSASAPAEGGADTSEEQPAE